MEWLCHCKTLGSWTIDTIIIRVRILVVPPTENNFQINIYIL
jgi:hypothetical protein